MPRARNFPDIRFHCAPVPSRAPSRKDSSPPIRPVSPGKSSPWPANSSRFTDAFSTSEPGFPGAKFNLLISAHRRDRSPAGKDVPRCFQWNTLPPQPGGRKKIAQRFIAGSGVCAGRSPARTTEFWADTIRRKPPFYGPCGTGREDTPKASFQPSPDGWGLFHRKQRGTLIALI